MRFSHLEYFLLLPCSRELKCEYCAVAINFYNRNASAGRCVLNQENIQYLKRKYPEYCI